MVHLTKIYTRTGDDGTTALGDFSRTSKNDSRLIAYADVDETNAEIGAAIALGDLRGDISPVLLRIQNELFDVGADLCTPIPTSDDPTSGIPTSDEGRAQKRRTNTTSPLRIGNGYVEALERDCDQFNAELKPLRSFILPGGTPGSALLHCARTSCRRAERSTWTAIDEYGVGVNRIAAKYLNRLSDLLFILARSANGPAGDVLWKPGESRNYLK